MKPLKGTKTHENLKAAFAGESQANRRYLYFAAQGRRRRVKRRVGGVPLDRGRRDRPRARPSRVTSQCVGDPATNLPIGAARQPEGGDRRRDARIHRHVSGHGEAARGEGFDEIADWIRDAREGRALPRQPLSEALDTLAD